jgi:hypothetical protein
MNHEWVDGLQNELFLTSAHVGVVSPNRRKFRQAGFQAFGRLAPYPVSRYTFCGSKDPIDLDAMLANLTLEEGEHSLSQLWIRSD